MITPIQSTMARAALKWSLHDLAEAANVGVSTVRRFERGETVIPIIMAAIEMALADRGVRFNDDGWVAPPLRHAALMAC